MPLTSRDVLFVLRAQDFASREVRSLAGSFGILNRQMRSVADEGSRRLADVDAKRITQIREQQDLLTSGTRAYKTQNKELLTANARMREEIATGEVRGKQLAAHQAAMATNSRIMAENNQRIQTATHLHEDESRAIQRAAQDNTAAIQRQIDEDKQRIRQRQELVRHYQASGATMMATGAIMAAAGAAGLFGLFQLTKGAAEFRQGVALAQTQAQDLGLSIKQLEGVAYSVGENIPVPLEELSQGLYDIYSSIDFAGDSLKGGQRLLSQFARDAVAGQVELEEASRSNIAVMNAWRMETSRVGDVSDIMFRLVERGIGTYGEFTNSIGRAIPASVRAGQEFDTLAASMAYLTRQGLSTEMAATAAARAMELLSDPRVVSKMEAQGIAVRDASGNFLHLRDILQQLNERWGELPAPERAAKMMDVFSGAGYRIQARRFLDTVIPGFEEFNEEIERMEDRSGAARRAYNTMFAQPVSQVQLFVNQARILGNELGENLFGALNRILGVGMAVIKWFRDLSPATKSLITGFVEWASVALILLGIIRILIGVGKVLYGTLKSLQIVQGLTMGFGAMNAALTGTSVSAGVASAKAAGLTATLMGPAGLAAAALLITGIGLAAWAKKSEQALITASEGAATLADSVGAAFVDIDKIGNNVDQSTDSLRAFALANQDVIKRVRELGTELGKGYLLEIAFQLSMRSDMTPEEIEKQINTIANLAGITLDVPITIGDNQDIGPVVDSAMARIREGLEASAGWQHFFEFFGGVQSIAAVPLNSLKQEMTGLAETIGPAFESGMISADQFSASLNTIVTGIQEVSPNATIAQENVRFMIDEIARIMGLDVTKINDISSLLLELAAAGAITQDELLKLQLTTDHVETGFTDAEASMRREILALENIPGAASGAEDSTDDLTLAQRLLQQQTDQTTSELQAQVDMMRAQTDPIFAAINAYHGYHDAIAEVEEIRAREVDSAEDAADKQRDLRDALLEVASSRVDLESAIAGLVDENGNLIASAEDVMAVLGEMGVPPEALAQVAGDTELIIGMLEEVAANAGIDIIINSDQATTDITDLVGQLEGVPDFQQIIIDAHTAAAERKIANIRSMVTSLSQLGGSITVGNYTVPGIQVGAQHEGGHAGDFSGVADLLRLKSDEIPTVLQRGEFVLSKEMVAALQGLPKLHGGGGIGPWGGADVTARTILSNAGSSSSDIQAAIDKVNELKESWEDAAQAAEDAAQRAELVRDIHAAEDAEERSRATEALREFDLALAQSNVQRAIDAAIEQAEIRKTIELNREQWRFDHMTTQEQLANLNRRIANVKKYTDEWMQLAKQREQVQEQLHREEQERIEEERRLREERQQAYENELAELNRMLDERERIIDQMKQQERDYAQAVKDAQKEATQAIKDAQQARRDQLEGQFRLDASEGVGNMVDLARAQNEQIQEWHEGLLELQRRGLSTEVIEALGLADSPEQLQNVRNLLDSSVDDLDNLNEAIAERQGILNNIIKEESSNTAFELADSITSIRADLQAELQEMSRDHIAATRELRAELNAIGKEQGRSWSTAIAEGIKSGIPAIVKQAEAVRAALRIFKGSTTTGLTLADFPFSKFYDEHLAGIAYDNGGPLPPGFTLAYNGTGRTEWVSKSPVGSTTLIIEDGAFQFNGPIDSATLPEVEALLEDVIDRIEDQLRKGS